MFTLLLSLSGAAARCTDGSIECISSNREETRNLIVEEKSYYKDEDREDRDPEELNAKEDSYKSDEDRDAEESNGEEVEVDGVDEDSFQPDPEEHNAKEDSYRREDSENEDSEDRSPEEHNKIEESSLDPVNAIQDWLTSFLPFNPFNMDMDMDTIKGMLETALLDLWEFIKSSFPDQFQEVADFLDFSEYEFEGLEKTLELLKNYLPDNLQDILKNVFGGCNGARL